MKSALLGLLLLLPKLAQAQVVTAQGHKLMIFGGEDHKTYLGCLSCSSMSVDSVVNSFGPHGSKFMSDSIFNTFGEYGGKFSNYSPCNSFATEPPVIVDEQGDFYGRLTINKLHPQAAQSDALQQWIAGVCAG